MKPIRMLGLIVSLCLLGYYGYRLFGNPNGKKYEIDKNHHVFYKGDGVTETDAKNTADYLKEIGLVQASKGMDVQIKSGKVTDDVKFSLVFDKAQITPETESSALGIGTELSNRVFNGRRVSVVFVDDNMDEIKNLGYSPTQTPAQIPNQQNNQTDTKQTDDAK